MTDLSRRGFLRALGFGTVATAAAANSVFDIERLLWVPGEQTIILPPIVPAVVARGNTFVTPEWIAMEWLRILENQLVTMDYSRYSR